MSETQAKRYIVIAIMDNDPVGAIECDSEETANLLAAATEERFMDVRAWVQYIGVADVVTKDTIAETLDELDGSEE